MGEHRSEAVKEAVTEKLRPSPALLELILSNCGEGKEKQRDVFSRQEIITHLRTYITKHELYDSRDPRLNYCDDLLRRIFNVKQFTISEVLPLIASTTSLVKSPTLRTSYDVIDGDAHVIESRRVIEKKTSRKRRRSEIEEEFGLSKSSSNNNYSSSNKRRRNSSSFSTVILTSDDDGRWSVDVALHSDLESCLLWTSDDEGGPAGIVIEWCDDASERLSVQSKDTMLIEEMEEQDFWVSDDDDDEGIDISIRPFSVEYDVISSSDEGGEEIHDPDTSSEPEVDGEPEMAAMLVVCRESDVEFFADYSDSEDDVSDREIPNEDKWQCDCSQQNTPLSRYCQKCWAIRPGWVQQQQGGRRRAVPAKYQVDPDYLSDLEDDSPIPLQEAIIASLATSEPATETPEPRLDSVDGTPEMIDSQTSGYFSQNSMQSTSTPTLNSEEMKAGPSGLCSKRKPSLGRSKSMEQWASPSLRTGALKRSISTQDKSGANLIYSSNTGEVSVSKWLSSQSKTCSAKKDSQETNESAKVEILETVQSSDCAKPSSSLMEVESSTESDSKGAEKSKPRVTPQPQEQKTETSKNSEQNQKDSITESADDNSALCIMCTSRPKNASLIHGKTGHQTTCYKCAKKLRRRGKPCPVCRKPIQRVIRNFIV